MPEIRLPEINPAELPAEVHPEAISAAAETLSAAVQVAHTQLENLAPEILARVEVAEATESADAASHTELHTEVIDPAVQVASAEAPSLPATAAEQAVVATQANHAEVATDLSLADDLWDRFEASLPSTAVADHSVNHDAPVSAHESATVWPDVHASLEAINHVPGGDTSDVAIHTFDWTSHLG